MAMATDPSGTTATGTKVRGGPAIATSGGMTAMARRRGLGPAACVPVDRRPAAPRAQRRTGGPVEPFGFEHLRREPAGVADVGDEIPDLVGRRRHGDRG